MFASKIARPQAKVAADSANKAASPRPGFAARPSRGITVGQAQVLQRVAVDRARLRLGGTHLPGQAKASQSGKVEGAADFQQRGGAAEASDKLMDKQGGKGGPAPTGPVGSGNVVADQQASPGPSVTFTRVRATTTPVAMAADRVTPGVDFSVTVAVANWHIPMLPLVVSVDGSGGANGTATVDGGATRNLVASGSIQLRGTAQTAPGNAGGLQLAARWGTQVVGRSNQFSVAAIPQDMVLSGSTALTGDKRGFVVTQTWSSDSGTPGDLDRAKVSEAVQYVSSTGIFAGLGANNSGYITASGCSLTDTHSAPVSALTGAGTRLANQTEMFLDERTGARDIPMRASGFTIARAVTADASTGVISITTTKAGAAVTANGIASGAGSGNISLTQQV